MKNKSRRAHRGPRVGAAGGPGDHVVPELMVDDVVSTAFRYQASGGAIANAPFTRANMLNLLVMAGNATGAYRMFGAVKLKRIRVWSSVGITTGPYPVATSTLQWNAQNSRNKTITSTSMGYGSIGMIDSRPPKDSLASFWSIDQAAAETDILFTLDLNMWDVIQLDVVYTIQNNVTGAFTVNTLISSGMATGKVYQPTLDHGGSQFVVAVGRPAVL
jgi:hypothetical protein